MRSLRRLRAGGDRGASALELVLYMPLLMGAIFITVQFALIYLGNQVVASSVRQAARVARDGGGTPAAMQAGEAAGRDYATRIGHGLVTGVTVDVAPAGGLQVRAVVRAKALQLVPGIQAPQIVQVSQGPVETFRPDN